MQLTRLFNLSFKQNIIDYHAHTGEFYGSNFSRADLDRFTRAPLPNGDKIEKMVVSNMDPFNKGADEYSSNSGFYKKIKNNDRYLLMLSCSPKNGNSEKLERFIQKYPHAAKGLKFHPNAQKLPVGDSKYEPYFDLADKYNLPCMFHCVVPVSDKDGKMFKNESGEIAELDQYSDPELIYKAAKKHPNTPFVIAHMGSGWRESHDRTIDILVQATRNGDANLYSDISWVDIDTEVVNGHRPKEHIIKAIKELKGIGDPTWDKGDQSFRLIFGTDTPIGRFGEKNGINDYVSFVEEIKYAIRHDKDLAPDAEQIIEDIFYNNAKRLIEQTRA
ncbi:MAG: amidohydrolase family protein [Candidatus Gastranaerophilales bacterium]|nr:amidohydrolase family protein [Candidatus Gastranaerophilales bacterium]